MGLKHQAAAARKWRSAARLIARRFPVGVPPLLFLTDPERTPDPVSIAADLPAGSGVVYRHFGTPDRGDVAAALAETCARRRLALLIAADPGLASSIGADGVHWPEKALNQASKWRGRFRLQTASAHSRAALCRAAKVGMDAAILSTVFPSDSASAEAPLGPIRFRRVSQAATIPVYALGGVHAGNVFQIAPEAGAASVSGFIA